MVGCCWAAGVPEIDLGAALPEDLAVVVVAAARCWVGDSAKKWRLTMLLVKMSLIGLMCVVTVRGRTGLAGGAHAMGGGGGCHGRLPRRNGSNAGVENGRGGGGRGGNGPRLAWGRPKNRPPPWCNGRGACGRWFAAGGAAGAAGGAAPGGGWGG